MSTLKENVDRTSLASLNRQTIEGLNKDISGVLAKDPEADISHVLEVCLKRYGRRKARREAASARSQTRGAYRSASLTASPNLHKATDQIITMT